MCAMYMKFDEWEKESERKSILSKRAASQNISKLKHAALVDVDKSGQYSRPEISIGGQRIGGQLVSPKAGSFKIPRRDSFTFASSSEDGLEPSLDEDLGRKRLLVTPRRKRKKEGSETLKDKRTQGKICHIDSERAGLTRGKPHSFPEERSKMNNNRITRVAKDEFLPKKRTNTSQKTLSASKQVQGRSFKDLVNFFSDEANDEDGVELPYESSDDEDSPDIPLLFRQGFARGNAKSLQTKPNARGPKDSAKEKAYDVEQKKDVKKLTLKRAVQPGNKNVGKREGIFHQLRRIESSGNEQSSDHESESDDVVKGYQSEVKRTSLARKISKAGKIIRSTSCDSFSRDGKHITLKRSESSVSSRNSAKSATTGKREEVFIDSDKEKVVCEIFGSHSESSHDESDDVHRHSKTERNAKSCATVNSEKSLAVYPAIKGEEYSERTKYPPEKGYRVNSKDSKQSLGGCDKEDSREEGKDRLGLEKKSIEKIRAIVKRKERQTELPNKDSALPAASLQFVALSPVAEKAAVNSSSTKNVTTTSLPVIIGTPTDASLNDEKLRQQPLDLVCESALDKVTPFVDLVVKRIGDQKTENSSAESTSTSAIFSVITKGASCTEKEVVEQMRNIVKASSQRDALPIRIVTVLNKDLYTSVLAKNTVDSIPEFIITSIL